MKHPIYNTKDKLAAEIAFAEKIATRADMELSILPGSSPLDYALVDPKTKEVQLWLEVSCRTDAPIKEIGMSLSRWMAGVDMTRKTGIPFLVGFRWKDTDFILQVREGFIPLLQIGGESDRIGDADKEPVVKIPFRHFHSLK